MPRPGEQKKYGTGTRKSWGMLWTGNFRLAINKDPHPIYEDEEAVVLNLGRVAVGRTFPLNLTDLRLDELEALREFFNRAFDEAEPVVRRRTEEVNADYERGGEPDELFYRPVPQAHYREGRKPEHSEGVRDRPEDAPEVPRDGFNPPPAT